VWTNEEGGDAGPVTTLTLDEKGGQTLIVLTERYPTKDAYVTAVKTSAEALVAARMLLPADAARLTAEAQEKGVRSAP
jgi:hypothetical protein